MVLTSQIRFKIYIGSHFVFRNVGVKVILIVMGALGTVPRRLPEYLRMIGVSTRVEMIQKTSLLGSARILRKVMKLNCKRIFIFLEILNTGFP